MAIRLNSVQHMLMLGGTVCMYTPDDAGEKAGCVVAHCPVVTEGLDGGRQRLCDTVQQGLHQQLQLKPHVGHTNTAD